MMIDLWELRNKEEHGKEEATKAEKEECQSSYQFASLT